METNLMKAKRGQSLIEYVLLLSVISVLIMTVFRNDSFQRVFGKNSDFFEAIAKSIESNYRFGLSVENGRDHPHPTFFRQDGISSRYFSTKEGYPER